MRQEIATVLEQAQELVQQHAPADLIREAVPFGIVCLIAGVGLSVLGAKLARFSISGGFVLLGAWVGVYVARLTGFPAPICGLLGALMLGIVGYQTYRLWVGAMAAVVLSSAMLGVFGYQRVLPHVSAFQQQAASAHVEGVEGGEFAVPTPQEQAAYLQRSPKQWAKELWGFIAEKDTRVTPHAKALTIGAMITGLCLGVLAVRWALILSTSLLGTALVTTAITTLTAHAFPGSYESLQNKPGIVGIGVGAFLVFSLVLQTMLTRTAPAGKSEGSS